PLACDRITQDRYSCQRLHKRWSRCSASLRRHVFRSRCRIGQRYTCILRSLGSSTSRNESPRTFVEKTSRLIASPGHSTINGSCRMYVTLLAESMEPHEGCGGGTPRP